MSVSPYFLNNSFIIQLNLSATIKESVHSHIKNTLFILLTCFAFPTLGDDSSFCSQASEEEFRRRLHDDGKFQLYDEFGVLSRLVESGFEDLATNEMTIERYQQDAASVSQLLSELDESFWEHSATVKLYNKLSRYDGTSVENPDGSRLVVGLAPGTKQELQERFEKIEDVEEQKKFRLKFRYSIAALGVYLDRSAEDLRAQQATRLQNLKEMATRSSNLRVQLSSYCTPRKKMSALRTP